MLSILLKILSIIGITLLVLLLIALVLLLLMLFVPIRYEARGRKDVNVLEAEAKVSWLFGTLRAIVTYKGGLLIRAKLLFFTLYDSDKPPKNRRSKKTGGKNRRLSRADKLDENNVEADMNAPEPAANNKKEGTPADKSEEPSKFEKIKYTIANTYDKIKKVLEDVEYYKKLLDDKETRGLLKHVLFRLGNILKVVKPRVCEGDIVFGAASPDTTGYLYGVYGMVSPHLGEHFYVTPDFTRTVLEGTFEMSGRFMLCTVLVQLIKVLLDRRLRIFLDKIKKKP